MARIGQILLYALGAILGVAYLFGLGWGIYWLFTHVDTSNYWTQRMIALLFGLAGSAGGLLIARKVQQDAEREQLSQALSVLEQHVNQLAEGSTFSTVTSVLASNLAPLTKYLPPELSLPLLQCASALERIATATGADEAERSRMQSLHQRFIASVPPLLAEAQKKLGAR
jgi:hypothetical protein